MNGGLRGPSSALALAGALVLVATTPGSAGAVCDNTAEPCNDTPKVPRLGIRDAAPSVVTGDRIEYRPTLATRGSRWPGAKMILDLDAALRPVRRPANHPAVRVRRATYVRLRTRYLSAPSPVGRARTAGALRALRFARTGVDVRSRTERLKDGVFRITIPFGPFRGVRRVIRPRVRVRIARGERPERLFTKLRLTTGVGLQTGAVLFTEVRRP